MVYCQDKLKKQSKDTPLPISEIIFRNEITLKITCWNFDDTDIVWKLIKFYHDIWDKTHRKKLNMNIKNLETKANTDRQTDNTSS